MDVVPIRAEVIEARRTHIAGPIVLARPVPVKLAGGWGSTASSAEWPGPLLVPPPEGS